MAWALIWGLAAVGCGMGDGAEPLAQPTSSPTPTRFVEGSVDASNVTADRVPAGSIEAVAGLTVPRAAHTATRLDDGRILIAGGCSRPGCGGNGDAVVSELFDPIANVFVEGPSMTTPRAGHTATLLEDGRVLIVGGYDGEGRAPLASAELFDPVSNQFSPTGSMAQGRGSHTATTMNDGRVLIVGGVTGQDQLLNTVEIYEPSTETFRMVAGLSVPRATHAAARVASGEVLVIGGRTADRDTMTPTTVLYDPVTDQWAQSGDLHTARQKHAAVSLADGSALVIGGSDHNDFLGRLTTLERWEPASGAWTPVANLASGRFKIPDAVAILSDGRVVIAGDGIAPEVFDPTTNRLTGVVGTIETPLMFATATALADDGVLIVGGYDENVDVKDNAYLYRP